MCELTCNFRQAYKHLQLQACAYNHVEPTRLAAASMTVTAGTSSAALQMHLPWYVIL